MTRLVDTRGVNIIFKHKEGAVGIESDAFGEINVSESVYFGAQTARSLHFFKIGPRMPTEVISGLLMAKRASALTNQKLGLLSNDDSAVIVRVCDEILNREGPFKPGLFEKNFPLKVFQTGSGTQSNMNVNEVIACRANELLTGVRVSKSPIHPNDHVNKSQSSNDIFPTAMHIAARKAILDNLLKELTYFYNALNESAGRFASIIKIGRTHLQDAVPICLGDEFKAYAYQVNQSIKSLSLVAGNLSFIAQGGTAVGNGANCPIGFKDQFSLELSLYTGLTFLPSPNLCASLSGHIELLEVSNALNTFATTFFKIANDIRLMASGPRAGFGELTLPANEPGSSIMPGKVNPTQCEAATQVCLEVMGNHLTISMACSQGHLELNVYKPLIIFKILTSIRLLSDAVRSFTHFCLKGIQANEEKMKNDLKQSLMLVTYLTPKIGYDRAVSLAQKAHAENKTIEEVLRETGDLEISKYQHLVPFNLDKPSLF